MQEKICVFIADDHAIVREGLKRIVHSDEGIEVCGEAATGSETIASMREREVDVLVLDVSFPDRSGFDVLSHVKAARPRCHVLMLSMEREEEFAIRALRAGADGYIEKRSAPEQLIQAIRRVAEGRKYLTADLVETLALDRDHAPAERPHDLLSPREFDIFLAIAGGKPVREIAANLGLSVKTVNNHRARVLAKLRVKSTAELVRYAIRHALIR
ncbi:MAG TPA: response regulator transcription factor [Thermoanaerobaculia bacterium]|nr:response regulator transcription factor [Thermoanaerobaculia bacterium]